MRTANIQSTYFMPCTILSTLLSFNQLQQSYEADTIIPILQMRKLRNIEVKQLFQEYTPHKWYCLCRRNQGIGYWWDIGKELQEDGKGS